MSTNPDHQALFNRVMRMPDKISARHLDAAIASTADGREALRQVAQSGRFASHWCEQEPREAASACSEIQESEATERKRGKKLNRADYLFSFLFVLLACVACGAVIAALP